MLQTWGYLPNGRCFKKIYFYHYVSDLYTKSCEFILEKIKLTVFSFQMRPNARGLREINIFFVDHSINQHKTGEYLGYQLGSNWSREVIPSKVIKAINVKLKFLYC